MVLRIQAIFIALNIMLAMGGTEGLRTKDRRGVAEKKGSGQTGPLQPSRPSTQQADWPWPITGWLRATPTRPIHPDHVPQVEGDFQRSRSCLRRQGTCPAPPAGLPAGSCAGHSRSGPGTSALDLPGRAWRLTGLQRCHSFLPARRAGKSPGPGSLLSLRNLLRTS